MIARVAYKNLFRSYKRFFIKVTGIAIITAVMMVWGALGRGMQIKFEQLAKESELGDFQIHQHKYLESDSIYDTVPDLDVEKAKASGIPYSAREYGLALASDEAENSAGVRLWGLNPSDEARVTSMHKNIIDGKWFSDQITQNKPVVIGHRLARILGRTVGQTMILIAQAADGSLASQRYQIIGIMGPLSDTIDRRAVFMLEGDFRELMSLYSGTHEIAFAFPSSISTEKNEQTMELLKQSLSAQSSLQTWAELRPLIRQLINLLYAYQYFILGMIYFALGCFILNSTMMSIFDRVKEYGVMLAIGLKPSSLRKMIILESTWLAFIAAIFAALIGYPAARYFEVNGLDFTSLVDEFSLSGMNMTPILHAGVESNQFLAPILFLILMMPLAALYPSKVAAKLQPLDALRGGQS